MNHTEDIPRRAQARVWALYLLVSFGFGLVMLSPMLTFFRPAIPENFRHALSIGGYLLPYLITGPVVGVLTLPLIVYLRKGALFVSGVFITGASYVLFACYMATWLWYQAPPDVWQPYWVIWSVPASYCLLLSPGLIPVGILESWILKGIIRPPAAQIGAVAI